MKRIILMFVTCFVICAGSLAQSTHDSGDYSQRLRMAELIMASADSPASVVDRFGGMMAVKAIVGTQPSYTREANSHLTDAQFTRSIGLFLPVISQITEKFSSEGMRSTRTKLVVAYAEKFTLSELMEIANLQKSQLGRKLQEVAKAETREAMKPAMAAAETMGKEINDGMAKIRQQLAQEGIVLK